MSILNHCEKLQSVKSKFGIKKKFGIIGHQAEIRIWFHPKRKQFAFRRDSLQARVRLGGKPIDKRARSVSSTKKWGRNI
jgi:hypothetical protein